MKHIYLLYLLLFSGTILAQDFDRQWEKVIRYESAGKIRSAAKVTENIYTRAQKQKNSGQLIKTFFYRSKYMLTLKENAQNLILKDLRSEMSRADVPTKALLKVIYARCLADYRSANIRKIWEIKTTLQPPATDIHTWSYTNFTKEIEGAYQFSSETIKQLQDSPLSPFEAVLDLEKNMFRGTASVYDYVLKEKLTRSTGELYSTGLYVNPAIKLNKELFGSTDLFLTTNPDSLYYENAEPALKTLIEIERANPDSDNVLQRLVFIKQYISYAPNYFIEALNRLKAAVPAGGEVERRITLEQAKHYTELASREHYPDYNKKAIQRLETLLAHNDHSAVYREALLVKNKILTKSLHVKLPDYLYAKQHSRMLIRYRNISGLHMKVYKVSESALSKLTPKTEAAYFEQLRMHEAVVEKDVALPLSGDHLEYTYEALMPQLDYGTYIISFSHSGLNDYSAVRNHHILRITDLTVLMSHNEKENYQVLHRKTGKPISGARIQTRGYAITTNYEGAAALPVPTNYVQENVLISHESDTLLVARGWANSRPLYHLADETPKGHLQLYLDRAIYRPGQKVYYKGVLLKKYKGQTEVVPNTSVKLILENNEYDEVVEETVKSNEYGSFAGSFDLPMNGMTGRYRILAEEPDAVENDAIYDLQNDEHPFWDQTDFQDASISFSVEEYKRPRFEVTMEPILGDVVLGQQAFVKGAAVSYDGSRISEATVKYKITRRTLQIYGAYNGIDTIISSGTDITDADGKFTIGFFAMIDNKSDRSKLPVFNYHVSVEITDINGETHEATQTIKSGYHSIIPKVKVPPVLFVGEKALGNFSASNLNNAKINAKGELLVYFLQETSTKFKNRQWLRADDSDLTEAEFSRLFPYEPTGAPDPTDGTLLKTLSIDTKLHAQLPLDFLASYIPGSYRAVFRAIDRSGLPVEDVAFFELKNDALTYDTSTLFTITQINVDAKTDGYVRLRISSVIPALSIQLSALFQSKQFKSRDITLYNHSLIVDIPIPNEISGSLCIIGETVFENQFFEVTKYINAPRPVNELSFTIQSFRNKLDPGSQETWSFNAKSKSGVNDFEILASMYDSSLDIFAKETWDPLLFPSTGNYGSPRSVFGISNSEVMLQGLNPRPATSTRAKTYPELIWFGFDFNNKAVDPILYKKQLTKKARKPANATMINGIVLDGGLPLPGVSVTVLGTIRSTQTDIDGYYEIEAATGEQLVFSYIGYVSTKTEVNQRTKNIEMAISEESLENVVLTVGYSSSVKMDIVTVEDRANAAIIQNLAGQISGLNIAAGSGQAGSDSTIILRGVGSINKSAGPLFIVDGIPVDEDAFRSINQKDILNISILKDAAATSIYGSRGGNGVVVINTKATIQEMSKIQPRKNLSETAFFFPELYTDPKGNFSFTFKSPEALTAWKMRMLAHDKAGNSGVYEQTVITQKDIMLTPNMPRFFRDNDSITIQCKIANITAQAKTGIAMLQLSDAVTMENVDDRTNNGQNTRAFTIPPNGSTMVSWKIIVPEGLQGMHYKVVALSGDFSDGEENIIPVLTNNMLVTESIPLWVTKNSSKEFVHENLIQNTSNTLRNHQLTLEYTSNPAWLAIQSLPYLMEYEHECAEQTFARFYANAVAGHIIGSNPKIAELFKHWERHGGLSSELDKNSELKSIILAETPWLNDAADETILKKNMALLFDLQKLRASQSATFKKLANKQNSSGGFPWFEGGTENGYITRHIIAGFGKMEMIDIEFPDDIDTDDIIENGIEFLDDEFLTTIRKAGKNHYVPYHQLHYLYSRSFFLKDFPMPTENTSAVRLLMETVKKDWLTYPLFNKAMAALIFSRMGDKALAGKILTNLKETAVIDQQIGMYWLENSSGRYWYQSPVETQALIIEAFAEIANDKESIDALKVWLIRNKQRNNWPTTKSTTEAIYSLLLTGTDVLSIRDIIVFTIGDDKIVSRKLAENEKEAQTGYVKMKWTGAEVTKDLATLTIQNKSDVPGYGGFYWQYFENLDKIQGSTQADLSVSKQLFINDIGSSTLKMLQPGQKLKVGQKLTVRLTVIAREDAEFVHLKDMRASCFEPEFVKSEYKWGSDIGYYMSTRDAATHFFFDEINKGTYILEYNIRVNNNGDFSNGVTTIQSMYAPEFASHTEGIRVSVGE